MLLKQLSSFSQPIYRFDLIAVPFMAAFLLSACFGNLPSWPFWGNDEPVQVVELSAWLPVQHGEEETLLAAQVAELATVESSTPITLTLLATDTGDLDRVLRSEKTLDLFEVDLFRLPALVEDGRLAPLFSLPAALPSMSAAFDPGLIDAATIDGVLYCLPKDVHTLGLFYNMDLFDAAEISYPSDRWTWDELSSAAEAIGGLPTVRFTPFGLVLDDDISRWLPFFLQAGGSWGAEGGGGVDNAEAVGQALSFYDGLLTGAGAIQPEYFGSSWGGPVFGNGRVGMAIEGNWLGPYLDAEYPAIRYGVAPLPTGPGGNGTIAFGTCYAVSADSAHPAEALTVIDTLASDVAMRERLFVGAAIPARTSAMVAWGEQYPQLLALRSQLDGATIWQARGAIGQRLPELRRLLQDVIAGDLTVEEALDGLDSFGVTDPPSN
jgi:multiple sugar transport system substrate-binding protein